MIKIDLDYIDWKDAVNTKGLDHFFYQIKNNYKLIAIDGPLQFNCKLDQDDVADYEANYKDNSNKKVGSFYSREPFATKVLKDGSKLFRRKHGKKELVSANSEKEIIFIVPYAKAKINKLEIIDANALDCVDLLVKSPVDPVVAAAYGLPADTSLNEFGFDVVVSSLLYSDKSDYDADVFQGFQIVVKYKNQTNADKTIGFNLIYHEVV